MTVVCDYDERYKKHICYVEKTPHLKAMNSLETEARLSAIELYMKHDIGGKVSERY